MGTSALILIDDRRWTIPGSLLASLLLHLLAGILIFWIGFPAGSGPIATPSALSAEMIQPIEEEDKLKLGMNEASTASINWLGIQREEAVEGEAEISETDQAAQTPVVGNAPEFVEETAPQPIDEVVEDPTEPVELTPPEVIQPQEIAAAVEDVTNEVADAVGEMLGQAVDGIDQLMNEVASSVVIPERVEGGGETPIADPAPNPANAPTPVVKKSDDGVPGTQGVLSEREVVATRIKKAIKVDPRTPNAPIVGKGLEIKTVHPRYPTAVRLSALPKNPIILIYFDARGKVKRAEFLRDGLAVYSSGVVGVDEPLLNAIYQWTAKGKQVDDLDPNDPNATIEVSIKIIYRAEREIVPD